MCTTTRGLTPLWLALLAVCISSVRCSSSPTLPAPDTRAPDALARDAGAQEVRHADALADRARAERRATDTRIVDLGPDLPRPPAHWKSVPASPALNLEDHSLTMLASGDVLIVGGSTSTGNGADPVVYHNKAYRYVASQGTFVDAGTLAAARSQHSATLLADGRVLVVGGTDAKSYYLTSVELYDPAKPVASAWSAGPPMMSAAWTHAATRLQDGRVLISGGTATGVDSSLALALFDATTNSWSTLATLMQVKRRLHQATLLKSGKVLLSGGFQGTQYVPTYLDSLELFDPKASTTTLVTGKLSMARVAHVVSELDDGRVLIVGGYCTGKSCTGSWLDDVYDPLTGNVAGISHGGTYPTGHCGAKLLDGRVLITGGMKNVGGSTVGSAATVAFTATGAGSWTPQPDQLVGRWGARCALLQDGTLLVVGGVSQPFGPRIYGDAERFYP